MSDFSDEHKIVTEKKNEKSIHEGDPRSSIYTVAELNRGKENCSVYSNYEKALKNQKQIKFY